MQKLLDAPPLAITSLPCLSRDIYLRSTEPGSKYLLLPRGCPLPHSHSLKISIATTSSGLALLQVLTAGENAEDATAMVLLGHMVVPSATALNGMSSAVELNATVSATGAISISVSTRNPNQVLGTLEIPASST